MDEMLALLAAVLMFFFFCVVVVAFGVWVFQEHRLANEFRIHGAVWKNQNVQVAQPTQPTAPTGPPQWRIVYKEGKTVKTVILPGETESLALRELVKTAGASVYSSIVLITKV